MLIFVESEYGLLQKDEADCNMIAQSCAVCTDLSATTVDDFEEGEDLSEEEDTLILGGEGFSTEELAAAEARFTQELAMAQLKAETLSPVLQNLHSLPTHANEKMD